MSEPVLNAIASASELVVRFGNQAVLDHATVTILEGERVGLVGRNGSGKSTFLQIAAGVMKPDAGEFNPAPRPLSATCRRVPSRLGRQSAPGLAGRFLRAFFFSEPLP
jgi:ABC-type multidrug transport system ATPase subunit